MTLQCQQRVFRLFLASFSCFEARIRITSFSLRARSSTTRAHNILKLMWVNCVPRPLAAIPVWDIVHSSLPKWNKIAIKMFTNLPSIRIVVDAFICRCLVVLFRLCLMENWFNLMFPIVDMYQITMTYAYWKNDMCNRYGVFDLFFRKNPFGGEYTVFAGLEECLNYIKGFAFTSEDIQFFRTILPSNVEEEFYQYLAQINTEKIVLYSLKEGSVVFPKEPMLRVEGPLAICQLLETTLLTLVNYARFVIIVSMNFRKTCCFLV